jgi:hypothetical protein
MPDQAVQTDATHVHVSVQAADPPDIGLIMAVAAASSPPFPFYPPAFSLPCSWISLHRPAGPAPDAHPPFSWRGAEVRGGRGAW